MQGANKGLTSGGSSSAGLFPREQVSGLRIGIVQARFNLDITTALHTATVSTLERLGVDADRITTVTVPGALEVPIALQTLARSGRFDALVALGCIIRGETYHFELVANESGAGVTRVSLDHHIPIANAILTTEDLAQAQARQTEKGEDAAHVVVEMALMVKAAHGGARPPSTNTPPVGSASTH